MKSISYIKDEDLLDYVNNYSAHDFSPTQGEIIDMLIDEVLRLRKVETYFVELKNRGLV